jgi:hypothetical protein
MAEITITGLKFNEAAQLPATEAIDETGIATIDYGSYEDRRIAVMVENSDAENAQDVTVKKGTGIQATEDYVVSVPASSNIVLVLESGKYKDMSTAKVSIAGSTDVKVAAIALP